MDISIIFNIWNELKKIILDNSFKNHLLIDKKITNLNKKTSENILENFYFNDIYYQEIEEIIILIIYELKRLDMFSKGYIENKIDLLEKLLNNINDYDFRMLLDYKDYDKEILKDYNKKYKDGKFIFLFIIDLISNLKDKPTDLIENFKNDILGNDIILNNNKHILQQLAISYNLDISDKFIDKPKPNSQILNLTFGDKVSISNIFKILKINKYNKLSGLNIQLYNNLKSIYYDINSKKNQQNYINKPDNYYITNNGGNSYNLLKNKYENNPLNGPKSRIFNYEKLCSKKIMNNINTLNSLNNNYDVKSMSFPMTSFSDIFYKYKNIIDIKHPDLDENIYNDLLRILIITVIIGYIDNKRNNKEIFVPDNKLLIILNDLDLLIYNGK